MMVTATRRVTGSGEQPIDTGFKGREGNKSESNTTRTFNSKKENNFDRALLTTLILGGASLFTLYTVVSCSKDYLSERAIAIEKAVIAEKRANLFHTAWNYVTPPRNESRTYQIGEEDVTLSYSFRQDIVQKWALFVGDYESEDGPPHHKLEILMGDIKLTSYSRGERKDFSKLDNLFLYDGERWERFDWRGSGWQTKYEDLIMNVYNKRRRFEGEFEEKFEELIN